MPTEQQFADPIRYLSSPEVIRLGEQYGILKVRPPPGWRPKFALDSETFSFHTRLQTLKELSLANRSREFFFQAFNNYLRMRGKKPLRSSKNKNRGRKRKKLLSGEPVDPIDYDGFVSLLNGKRTHIYDIFLNENFPVYSRLVRDRELLDELQRYSHFVKGQLNKPEDDHATLANALNGQALNQEKGCEICHRDTSRAKLLICDGCDRMFHIGCLDPPLKAVPAHDWYCPDCLEGTGDYGFEEDFDNIFTLDEFKEDCDEFKSEYCDEHFNGDQHPSTAVLEKEFWKLVRGSGDLSNLDDTVEVRYGADIHKEDPSEISGFPTSTNPNVDPEQEKYYIDHFFNLMRLPFSKGSLLNYIKTEDRDQISGMTVPWIYVGSMFSTFCWHKEDHYTMSANYCHMGATKKWYAIPASDCDNFECLCKAMSPDYFAKQPDLMHQLVTLVSPEEIAMENARQINAYGPTAPQVHVYTVDQGPNEFVITFPKVYHAGFNCGFNVNEAVNFTMPYWLQFGEQSVSEYRMVKKENVFNYYKLLKNIMDTTLEDREHFAETCATFDSPVVSWMIRRAYASYYERVVRLAGILANHELCELMERLPKRDYNKYLQVKKLEQEAKRQRELTDGRRRRGRMYRAEHDEDPDDNPDEYICHDCKSFVNFQWVEVDLLKELEDEVKKETDPQLPTPMNSPPLDTEAQWAKIVEEAKREVKSDNDDGKPRRLRRSIRKRSASVEEDTDESGARRRERMIGRMKQKRSKYDNFGKLVLCLDCLAHELTRLSQEDRDKLIKYAILYNETDLGKLRDYLSTNLVPKIANAGIIL